MIVQKVNYIICSVYNTQCISIVAHDSTLWFDMKNFNEILKIFSISNTAYLNIFSK